MQETEITLVPVCPRAGQILADVSRLTHIGPYALLPKQPQWLHDYYLDTADQALRAQRFALRLRQVEQQWWLTLKGAPKVTDYGALERLEIEYLWSADGPARICEALAQRNVILRVGGPSIKECDALTALAALGLVQIQVHDNNRELRDVVTCEGKQRLIAELALDRVRYRFGHTDLHHYELELESKARDGSNVLRPMSQLLLTRYGPDLRIWCHSKLATGLALCALLNEHAVNAMRDHVGDVCPSVYDLVDRYLGRSDVS